MKCKCIAEPLKLNQMTDFTRVIGRLVIADAKGDTCVYFQTFSLEEGDFPANLQLELSKRIKCLCRSTLEHRSGAKKRCRYCRARINRYIW